MMRVVSVKICRGLPAGVGGFSLLEMLLAMVVSVILLIVALVLWKVTVGTWEEAHRTVGMRRDVRSLIMMMRSDMAAMARELPLALEEPVEGGEAYREIAFYRYGDVGDVFSEDNGDVRFVRYYVAWSFDVGGRL